MGTTTPRLNIRAEPGNKAGTNPNEGTIERNEASPDSTDGGGQQTRAIPTLSVERKNLNRILTKGTIRPADKLHTLN